MGDQAVYALDGAVVYQVKGDIGPDGRLAAWISDDDEETWKSMPSEPSGAFCAADGKLLSVVPDTGAAAFALTGGTSGAVVVYSVHNGWSVVHDAEGARVMAAVPSRGSGILLSQMGTHDLVRIDGSGRKRTVSLPPSSPSIAGIGDAVLVRNAEGKPEVVNTAP